MFRRAAALLLYSRSLHVDGVWCLVPRCQLTRLFFVLAHTQLTQQIIINEIQWPALTQLQRRAKRKI